MPSYYKCWLMYYNCSSQYFGYLQHTSTSQNLVCHRLLIKNKREKSIKTLAVIAFAMTDSSQRCAQPNVIKWQLPAGSSYVFISPLKMSQEDPNIHTLFGVEDCDLEKKKKKEKIKVPYIPTFTYLNMCRNTDVILSQRVPQWLHYNCGTFKSSSYLCVYYFLSAQFTQDRAHYWRETCAVNQNSHNIKTIISVTRPWIPDVHLSAI